MATLDSFVQTSRPPPAPLAASQEIRDRGSIFVANAFRASSEGEARRAVSHFRNVLHGQNRATHEMFAWRCMVLMPGRTGLGGPDDFEVKQGNEDDGEKYGSGRILKVMQAEGVIDAVVVVSRWCVCDPQFASGTMTDPTVYLDVLFQVWRRNAGPCEV
jgi:putative IMPACT (imprinted ancient) family translation regulator